MRFLIFYCLFLITFSACNGYTKEISIKDNSKNYLVKTIKTIIKNSSDHELLHQLNQNFNVENPTGINISDKKRLVTQIVNYPNTIVIWFNSFQNGFTGIIILINKTGKFILENIKDVSIAKIPMVSSDMININDINNDTIPDLMVYNYYNGKSGEKVEQIIFLSDKTGHYNNFNFITDGLYIPEDEGETSLYSGKIINKYLVIITNEIFNNKIGIYNDIEAYRFALPIINILLIKNQQIINTMTIPKTIKDEIGIYYNNFIKEHNKVDYSRYPEYKDDYFEALNNIKDRAMLKYSITK